MNITIEPYKQEWQVQVVQVWERSVSATHHFLLPDDFAFFKSIVEELDFSDFNLQCAVIKEKVIGFVGVLNNKIEMLFVDPDFFGKGIMKQLLLFSIGLLHATEVDVNEQNEKAVAFYKSFGFYPYARTEKDSSDKDYPIVKMKLTLPSNQ